MYLETAKMLENHAIGIGRIAAVSSERAHCQCGKIVSLQLNGRLSCTLTVKPWAWVVPNWISAKRNQVTSALRILKLRHTVHTIRDKSPYSFFGTNSMRNWQVIISVVFSRVFWAVCCRGTGS